MLTASKGDAAEAAKLQAQQQQQFMTLMMSSSAQQQQSMVAMMTALMQSRGGGPDEVAKYVQLLKTLGVAGGATEEDEPPGGIGKMVENVADAIQGLVLLKGGGQGGQGGQGGAPAMASAPGSAASLVDELSRSGQDPLKS
jgi:hypothetical protein